MLKLSRAQVRWRCRRGMLELDLILIRFFDNFYDTLSAEEQGAFVRLLEYSDPDLLAWLTHHTLPDDLGDC